MTDSNKFLPKLSQNFLEILDDNEYYDITIEVGDDPYVKVFRAHMVILNYRSPYLRRILSTNKKSNDGTLSHIKLSNISPEIFQVILRYIYGGKLSLKEYDASDIIKILISAGELSLHELIPHLQTFLIQNKSNWMEQNFNLMYKTSFENNSFVELQNYCTDLISKNPDKIFKSPNFSSTPENILVTLIKNGNLQMNEVEVWENVIKWGFAQNPELSPDPTSLSKDDFNVLKNTLQQCIPFIKFRNLTSKEFSEKVLPYKKILSKELYKDLLKDFLNLHPEGRPSDNQSGPCSKGVDSKIITCQHAELISKWIDKLENTDRIKNSYEFKLIHRGSRDGFTSGKFHEICDDQPYTVSIIKVKGSDEILGGYNPVGWIKQSDFGQKAFGYSIGYSVDYGVGNVYIAAEDSFIFSFKNKENIKDYILSCARHSYYAIRYRPDLGPSFGVGDLKIYSANYNNIVGHCKKSDYENRIRETDDKFSVEEYEVFQIQMTKP